MNRETAHHLIANERDVDNLYRYDRVTEARELQNQIKQARAEYPEIDAELKAARAAKAARARAALAAVRRNDGYNADSEDY